MGRYGMGFFVLVLAAAAVFATGAAFAGDDITGNLEDVGAEYAKAYVSPLATAMGVNMNSGLFTTASIPKTRLTVSVGLRVMGGNISEDDQNFRKVIETTLDESWGFEPGDLGYGQDGVIVLEGPTLFGDDETDGTATAYVGGIPIGQETTIPGVVETRWVPLAAPEVSVGGVMGLRATFRWLPSIGLGDLGDLDYLGYGLQYGVNNMVPTLPVDVMVGFFHQDLDIGDSVETSSDSFFIAASRSFAVATVYGGVAFESSSLDVSYTRTDGGEEISFDLDGEQDARFTLGATLNVVSKLNVELGFGELTSASAALLFGF